MRLASLFDLVRDAQDILDLFGERTENVEQLRSRLRRLGQLEAEELLVCLDGLRASVASALDDTLEMSPDLDDKDASRLDETLSDAEIENLDGEPGERQNPDVLPNPEK
jgi:hypothetical protein